jgi:hypothetical protein
MNNQISRFKLLRQSDLIHFPPMSWLVKGVLPANGTAVIYGPSASGKSFLCLDLAIAISGGESWFGRRVKAAPVVYTALEGEAGLKQRVDAWCHHFDKELPTNLGFILHPLNLTSSTDVEEFANSLPTGCVVFIDTLNRAAPNTDENSSRDMGSVIEAVKKIQRITGGLVVLVHHTGKNTEAGMRGHSSLLASLDAAIEVSRSATTRQWKITKAKDGIDGCNEQFILQVEEIDIDPDGDAVTSCVVKHDTSTVSISSKPVPQGENQKMVMEVLLPLFDTGETGVVGAPEGAKCIKLEIAINAGSSKLAHLFDKKTTRAREALSGLIKRGVICERDGWLWLI